MHSIVERTTKKLIEARSFEGITGAVVSSIFHRSLPFQVICCGIIRGSGRPKLGIFINFIFYYCAALPMGLMFAFYVFEVGLEGKVRS